MNIVEGIMNNIIISTKVTSVVYPVLIFLPLLSDVLRMRWDSGPREVQGSERFKAQREVPC